MAVNESLGPQLVAPPHFSETFSWLSGTFLPWLWYFITEQLFPRIGDFIEAPLIERTMLWAVAPLVITMVLMTFYFGVHKKEKLGWNTAFGNSMVLIFTAINLLQLLYGDLSWDRLTFNEDTIIALALMAEGMFLLFINFFHFVPERVAFYLGSPLHVNVLAIFGVIIVYSSTIPLDNVSLLAILVIYLAIGSALKTLYLMVPSVREHVHKVTNASFSEELPRSKVGIDFEKY